MVMIQKTALVVPIQGLIGITHRRYRNIFFIAGRSGRFEKQIILHRNNVQRFILLFFGSLIRVRCGKGNFKRFLYAEVNP